MTSYQRRQRDIEFLKQRGEDLERVALSLAALLNANKIPIPMYAGGVCGDNYLNDVNTGDFDWRLINAR